MKPMTVSSVGSSSLDVRAASADGDVRDARTHGLLTEDRPAYPDDCSAFFYRDAEIVRHPHRQLGHVYAIAVHRLETTQQVRGLAEDRTRGLGSRVWSHRHDAADLHAREAASGSDGFLGLLFRHAVLGQLAGNVHLQQHVLHDADLARVMVDSPQKVHRVHRVDESRTADDVLDLVRLQRADEMPCLLY